MSAAAEPLRPSLVDIAAQLVAISAQLADLADAAEPGPVQHPAVPPNEAGRVRAMLAAVAEAAGMPGEDITIRRPRGFTKYVLARQVASYLLRRETFLSYHDIRRAFGYGDHTTIMYACGKIQKQLDAGDARIRQMVDDATRLYRELLG